jgi:hypothetical protein
VAGPEIKNFAQIKVGDHLSVTFEIAVALELIKTKSDGIRSKQEASAVTTAQPGQKPAQTITNATEIIADVVAVDRAKKTASIKGPNGKVTVVKVKNPELLKDIAVGDVVRALFIDRMAASITPGKK